jgi:hypothetical protein
LSLMKQHADEDAKQQTGYDVTAVFHVNTNLAVLKANNLNGWGTNIDESMDEHARPFLLDLAAATARRSAGEHATFLSRQGRC